jgi:hypothetical protein
VVVVAGKALRFIGHVSTTAEEEDGGVASEWWWQPTEVYDDNREERPTCCFSARTRLLWSRSSSKLLKKLWCCFLWWWLNMLSSERQLLSDQPAIDKLTHIRQYTYIYGLHLYYTYGALLPRHHRFIFELHMRELCRLMSSKFIWCCLGVIVYCLFHNAICYCLLFISCNHYLIFVWVVEYHLLRTVYQHKAHISSHITENINRSFERWFHFEFCKLKPMIEVFGFEIYWWFCIKWNNIFHHRKMKNVTD